MLQLFVMPKDLTWNQLKQDLIDSSAITLSGTDIVISIGKVTGDTYNSLDNEGVTEFIQKLLVACNKTQARVNQGVDVGERLASYPAPNFGTPTKGTDSILRVTCTQQVVSRLTIDANSTVGNQN